MFSIMSFVISIFLEIFVDFRLGMEHVYLMSLNCLQALHNEFSYLHFSGDFLET